MAERNSVAVIGAGPAGLAAAWALASVGRAVRVYEASARPGGRLRTEDVGGATADAVVQLLSDGYNRTAELLDAMGLGDRLVEVPARDAVWRGGRAHGLRYGSAGSMAASGAIPTGLKLRLGLRYLPFLERHRDLLDLNEPVRGVEAGLDRESIAAWGAREVGPDFVEYMVYPLLASYYGVTPEETSAVVFHALARAGLHVSVLGVRDGFGRLAESMVQVLESRGVEVRLGAGVQGLEVAAGGVSLRLAEGAVEHAGVVVAVPVAAASRLLPGIPWLAEVPTRSTAHLVLAVDGPLETGWFGLSIPRREPPGDELAAVCVQSEKTTGLGGPGDAVVVIPAPAVAEAWARAPADDILARALPALERVLPGVGKRVREPRVLRLDGQVFVPAPGHFERLSKWEGGGLPGHVELAGEYLEAPTVEGAIRSGLASARRLSPAAV